MLGASVLRRDLLLSFVSCLTYRKASLVCVRRTLNAKPSSAQLQVNGQWQGLHSQCVWNHLPELKERLEILDYSYIMGEKGRDEGRRGRNGDDLKRKELENDFISSFTHSWIS